MCQCDNLSTPSQMDQFDVSQFYVEYRYRFKAFKHQSVKLSHIIDILLDLLFPNKIKVHPDYLTFIPDIVVIRWHFLPRAQLWDNMDYSCAHSSITQCDFMFLCKIKFSNRISLHKFNAHCQAQRKLVMHTDIDDQVHIIKTKWIGEYIYIPGFIAMMLVRDRWILKLWTNKHYIQAYLPLTPPRSVAVSLSLYIFVPG